MAEPRPPEPVLLMVAVQSRHSELLEWAGRRLEEQFGPIELTTNPYPFDQTTYYANEMGEGLLKQLVVFREPILPDLLAEIKLSTNTLEHELAAERAYSEARPLNLDPGLLSLGKFMLASMKDHTHRIYLRDGVYAEVTLHYRGGAWEPWPWTYADYRQTHVRDFLRDARKYLFEHLRSRGSASPG